MNSISSQLNNEFRVKTPVDCFLSDDELHALLMLKERGSELNDLLAKLPKSGVSASIERREDGTLASKVHMVDRVI